MEEKNKMEKKGRVCVTGGTGFLASWLIKRLLEDGYSVNATVRPSPTPGSGRNIDFLTDLPGAPERLQFFFADLDNPESFTPAIEGCIGVFHLAHPVDLESKETEAVRIKRSVSAVTGILQACLDSKTVKRVVYTSSASTIMVHDKEPVDETSWIDPDLTSKQFRNPAVASYALTKMAAEKAAWEFAEKNGLDLVTIIPTFIHGPFICPFLPGSVQSSMALIFGLKERYPSLMRTCFVHVEDVARAHIYLLEHSNAEGRYICSAAELTFEQLSEFLSTRYPEYPIPSSESLKEITREIKGFKYPGVSSQKLLDLGFNYHYGIEEMFDDAIQSCKQKGFL